MDYSVKWGKDEEEAIRLALDDLKVPREDVIITVLEESSKGFFGIGSKLAKVKIEKKSQTQIKADAEKRQQAQRNAEVSQRPASQFRGPDLRTHKTGEQKAEVKTEQRQERRSEQRPEQRTEQSSEQSPEQRSEQRSERRRERRPDRRREDRPKVYDNRPSKYTIDKDDQDAVAMNDSAAVSFLQDVTSKMGLSIQVEAYMKEGIVYINMEGSDSGTVIGKRGQTLDAIQYLTSLVVNKDQEKYIRVVVNAESYREKRENTLEQLARRLADKVKKSGKSVRLEPMNPYERKVIHATLQSSDHVTTRSEGEEPYRRVIIERK